MCRQKCADFLACHHTFWGEIISCSKHEAECKRRPLFKKIIGWAPKQCHPKLTRTTDPNLCPKCQRKRLKEHFARGDREDDETKARIQKGNITWDLDTARGTTDFRRDQRGRRHAEPVRVLTPEEVEKPAKSGRTREQTSRGHGDQQPSQVDVAAAPPHTIQNERRPQMHGSQGLPWPPPSSPPSIPLPLAPSGAPRRGRANPATQNPPLVPWQVTEDRPVSKALPPLPLHIKRKPLPTKESLSRHAERASSSRTDGKAPSHSSSRNGHLSRHRQDNDRVSRSRLPEPPKPASRDSLARETAHKHRGQPSSSGRTRHDYSQSRSDRSRELPRQAESSGAGETPKKGRTTTGSRFVEHFSSNEDIRRVRPTPAATMASAGGPSSARRGPPTSFDDERLRGPLPHVKKSGNAFEEERYRAKNRGTVARQSKGSGKKSTKSWLKNFGPRSPVETDVSFTCQSARVIEGRR